MPELRLDLPATALGKDYLGRGVFARAPSGTGGQISLFGVAGLLLALEEGLEVNLLGLPPYTPTSMPSSASGR